MYDYDLSQLVKLKVKEDQAQLVLAKAKSDYDKLVSDRKSIESVIGGCVGRNKTVRNFNVDGKLITVKYVEDGENTVKICDFD